MIYCKICILAKLHTVQQRSLLTTIRRVITGYHTSFPRPVFRYGLFIITNPIYRLPAIPLCSIPFLFLQSLLNSGAASLRTEVRHRFAFSGILESRGLPTSSQEPLLWPHGDLTLKV